MSEVQEAEVIPLPRTFLGWDKPLDGITCEHLYYRRLCRSPWPTAKWDVNMNPEFQTVLDVFGRYLGVE